MSFNRVLAIGIAAALVAGCESGDINLTPTTIDNSTGGGGGGPITTNPCALYEEAGQTYQGTIDANGNCYYNSLFVSDTRPIRVTAITFPALPNGALHVFEDSLFIGEDVTAIEAQSGVRIPQEGEGTRLTIAAGNTLVFTQEDSYVRIARGSQIFAEGTAAAPITFTSDEDAILDVATENDRGLWGGVQINGNGLTNKCSDGTATGLIPGTNHFAATANNVHGCHVTSEGRPATYGGSNNAESSGVLTYVLIKHAGFEVVDGDELNALTLNAVGSGTTISHVQTYTTQDDGFEMFGGAVNLDHIVAVNVGDDSIDYSEGYVGDVQYAVVLHTSGGNRCIEGDNTGENAPDGRTPLTRLRISNLTCITSNVDTNAGSSPSSKGDSEGPLFREGAYFEIYNSLITSNAAAMASNECFEIQNSEGPETIDAAQGTGTVTQIQSFASGNLIVCGAGDAAKQSPQVDALGANIDTADNNAFSTAVWLAGGDGSAGTPTNTNVNNVVLNDGTRLPASVVDGGVGTRGYLTSAALTDLAGTPIFDQATQLFAAGTLGGIFETPSYLGGASAADDWLAGWTVGLSGALTP